MKKLIIALLCLISFKVGFSQNLNTDITINGGKFGFGDAHYQLSFVVNSDHRNFLLDLPIKQNLTKDNKILSSQVMIDDVRPLAVIILEADVKNDNELVQLLKNIFQNLGLAKMTLNGASFTQFENIKL